MSVFDAGTMGSSNRKKKEKKQDFQVCFAKFLLQNWPEFVSDPAVVS